MINWPEHGRLSRAFQRRFEAVGTPRPLARTLGDCPRACSARWPCGRPPVTPASHRHARPKSPTNYPDNPSRPHAARLLAAALRRTLM